MKFFVDSANIDEIREMKELGLADGVTTNPSLIAKSGLSREEVAKNICKVIEGPVSVEVISTHHNEMLKEADTLRKIAPNICIKLPLTQEGLKLCRTLGEKGVNVNATLCFSSIQALLAARAHARFVSPFIGRMDDSGEDGLEIVSEIRQIYSNFNFDTEILAASIRNLHHIRQAALVGADIVTAPAEVLRKMFHHPLTEKGLEQFLKDYAKSTESGQNKTS